MNYQTKIKLPNSSQTHFMLINQSNCHAIYVAIHSTVKMPWQGTKDYMIRRVSIRVKSVHLDISGKVI